MSLAGLAQRAEHRAKFRNIQPQEPGAKGVPGREPATEPDRLRAPERKSK